MQSVSSSHHSGSHQPAQGAMNPVKLMGDKFTFDIPGAKDCQAWAMFKRIDKVDNKETIEIEDFEVPEEFRSHGWGAKFLDQLIEYCREHDMMVKLSPKVLDFFMKNSGSVKNRFSVDQSTRFIQYLL